MKFRHLVKQRYQLFTNVLLRVTMKPWFVTMRLHFMVHFCGVSHTLSRARFNTLGSDMYRQWLTWDALSDSCGYSVSWWDMRSVALLM